MTGDAGAPSRTTVWANPANLLTLLRIVLFPVIAVLLFADSTAAHWWATGLFAVAAASDWLDGWLARRWQAVSRWGKLADPLADKLLVVGVLAVLTWLGEVPWWALLVIVVREVAVSVQRQLLLRRDVVMPASIYGKGKTVSQIAAILLYLTPVVPVEVAFPVLMLAVLLTIASGVEYAWRGQRLVREG